MTSRIRMALRALLARHAVESEMAKEMRVHLDMETEANVRRGMSPAEARRAALVAFGGVEKAKEATRDERSTRVIDELAADLRYAWRGMRRRPAFALAVILLIGLGTGANTAIFSVVDETILHPLPYPDGNRMVALVQSMGPSFVGSPAPGLVDFWRTRARIVEEITAYRSMYAVLGDTTREPRRELEGFAIEPSMMAFLSLRPLIGRAIQPTDTMPQAPPVVMLGYRSWRSDFGGRRDIVGSTVQLGGRPYTVVGVAPKRFAMPYFGRGDFFVAKQGGTTRQASFAVGKLRKGYQLADANREAAAIGGTAPALPGVASGPLSLMDVSRITGANARRVVLILFAAVGFVLLIACANVANLLLARTWSRQREFAVRGAMGAGRGRLARQLFTECLVLAVLGGFAGFAVALAIDRIIVLHHPGGVRFEGRIDGLVFGWTMLVAIVTGLLFGVAPAALIGDGRLNEMLKSSARATTGSAAARRLRSTLVIVEVALSVVLLVGSGLLARSIVAMQQADIGIKPDGLASIVVRLPGRGFDESPDDRVARLAYTARVQRIPGVEAAAVAYSPPPDYAVSLRRIEVEGNTAGLDSLGPIQFNRGTQDFFRVTGLRFVEGRPYAFDAGANEMVVNERFANRFWPAGAIGHRVRFDSTWSTIVGVVANTSVPGEKGQGSGLQLYMPMVVAPLRTALIVRSTLLAPALEAALRAAIRDAVPRATVSDFELVTARLADARETHRFTLGLIGAFAGLALLLAAIGLGAVISYSVSQRMREMGIRIALGAQSSQVARLVLGQGVVLAAIGVVAGSAAGLAATRLMQSMLYGVSPGDPLTTAAVALLLLAVSALACALPARRATRVDPVEMVRAE